MKNVLVTGGCGFIGSNFVKYFLKKHDDCQLYNLDALTYAGNLENLSDIKENSNYHFIKGDICDKELLGGILQKNDIDTIINFAAETHVDRSIVGPDVFIQTNVFGTNALLEESKEYWGKQSSGFKGKKFVQISTDEVYGSLPKTGKFKESSPLAPSSPYSASKASADLIVMAYHKTFGYPSIITRCSNNYGPYQFPEKFIPLMIINALSDKALPIYGDGLYVRDWLFVEDHCEAIDAALKRGGAGEVYNIGGCNEKVNIDVIKKILKALGKPEKLMKSVKDRPGHDRRYAIDASKIMKDLKWKPKHKFEDGLMFTIDWYKNNRSWWEKVISGAYKKYYEKMYKGR
ncbi:dTDP-glucose 4,6-dehydratase [Candidatus Margulisiibacteriota bacterium]